MLPGQRRQRHDPSRSLPVDLRCQHGSTRFTQVGLPSPVLQGSPRWFLTCQKPPERPPVHPGPSGIIPVHHGGTTVQLPVLPGSPRSMDRGEPGSTGSPVGLGHICAIYAQLLVLRALGGASYRTGIILVVVRMAAPPATTSSALAHSSPTVVHRASMDPCRSVGDGGDASRHYLYTPVSITQDDNECRLEGDKTHEIFHFLSKKVGGGSFPMWSPPS